VRKRKETLARRREAEDLESERMIALLSPKVQHLPKRTPTEFYTVAELRTGQDNKLPEGVDPAARERWISPSEFKAVFDMDFAEFEALPKWRQNKLKKERQLF